MKVLITTDPIGGVWTFTLDLVRSLNESVEFLVAVEGGHPNDSQRQELDSSGASWRSTGNSLEWMDDPWSDVDRTGEWLHSLARDFHPDLVHLNSYSHAALPWECPVLVTAHSCVLSWWKDVKGELPPSRLADYGDRVRAGLAAADLVTAPTRSLLRDVQTFYGRPRASQVIANGALVEPSRGPKRELIAAAGRMWDEAKNLAVLEMVAPLVEWPIVACGEGSAEAKNLEGRGMVPRGELMQLLARASIFCAPAKYEPFGLTALEAAAKGCALVLGDIPSLREVWQGAATFVCPDSPEQIAAAIDRLASDPSELRRRSQAAHARALTLTIERMSHAYLHSYRSLIGEERVVGTGVRA